MIYTFYSFKGGVGRSMALANVAHWLYCQGLSVVMVDWDLEAPGLESFFCASAEEVEKVRSSLGVIDMLGAYERQFPYLPAQDPFSELPPLENHLVTLEPRIDYAAPRHSNGKLRLLPAGWRSGSRFADYAEAVQCFDWEAFYLKFDGQRYFDWLREQLLKAGDVVLVDSRTGISEMSGVCTRQLADVVVVVCAPNAQNLKGTLDMVQTFISPEVHEARGRGLEIVVLPARVDASDSKGHDEFREEFMKHTGGLTPRLFHEWKRTNWHLKIPYTPQYSYKESLVTGVRGANEELEQAYKGLAAHLALFHRESKVLWRACETELRVMAALAGRELESPTVQAASESMGRLTPAQQAAAWPVLIRLVQLSTHSPRLDARRRAIVEQFERDDAEEILGILEAEGLVTRIQEEAGKDWFELAHESFAKDWPELRSRIEAEREFLLWRQDLGDQALKWRDANRDPAALLRGAPLQDALRRAAVHKPHLNGWELEFLECGRAAEAEEEERRRRLEEFQTMTQVSAARTVGRRRRFVYGALALAAVGAPFLWMNWSSSELARVVESALAEGARIESAEPASEEALFAWRAALVVSGNVEAALSSINRIPDELARAGALAEAAGLLARSGQSGPANEFALQAVRLNQSGLEPREYASASAQVIAKLHHGGATIPEGALEVCLNVIGQLEPEARLGPLRWLLDLPDRRARTHYMNAAQELSNPGTRAMALLNFVEAARSADPGAALKAAEIAIEEGRRAGDSNLVAQAAEAAALIAPSPERWKAAIGAAAGHPSLLRRERVLGNGAGWDAALKEAMNAEGFERFQGLLFIYDSAQSRGQEQIRERAAGLAAETIAMEKDAAVRAHLFTELAAARFRGRELERSRDAAVEAILAAENAGSRESLSSSLTTLIFILYPGDAAEKAARLLNTPRALIALAAAARQAGQSAAARSHLSAAVDQARELKDEVQLSAALALAASEFAWAGDLSQASSLAAGCTRLNDHLTAQASILLAGAIKANQDLAKLPEVRRIMNSFSPALL